MREKYMVEPREFQLLTAQLKLCSFGTVDHEEFVAQIYDLRGRQVFGSGDCTTATEDVYVELFHGNCRGVLKRLKRRNDENTRDLVKEASPRTFCGGNHVERCLEDASHSEVFGRSGGTKFCFEDGSDAPH